MEKTFHLNGQMELYLIISAVLFVPPLNTAIHEILGSRKYVNVYISALYEELLCKLNCN